MPDTVDRSTGRPLPMSLHATVDELRANREARRMLEVRELELAAHFADQNGWVDVLIVDVIVHPDLQGRGLGRELVEALLEVPPVARARHTTLFAAPEVAPFYDRVAALDRLDGVYFKAQ